MILPATVDLPDSFDVVRCDSCWMIYNDSPVTEAELIAYYRSDAHTQTRPYIDNSRRFASLVDELSAVADRRASIVDWGSGDGALLGELALRGFQNVSGFDIQRPWAGAGPFDVFVLSHVLEHVLDPRALLDWMGANLSRDGVIVIETPDVSRYASCYQTSFSYFNGEHVNHFDLYTLSLLARHAGFGIISATVFDSPVSETWEFPCVRVMLQRGATRFDVRRRQLMIGQYIDRSEAEEIGLVVKAGIAGRVRIRGDRWRAWNLRAVLRDAKITEDADAPFTLLAGSSLDVCEAMALDYERVIR